jgi:hypothetical protein
MINSTLCYEEYNLYILANYYCDNITGSSLRFVYPVHKDVYDAVISNILTYKQVNVNLVYCIQFLDTDNFTMHDFKT